jgi:hypothetical protein
MLDVLADLLELVVANGIPTPSTLERQRQVRLAVSGLALVTNSVLHWLYGRPPVASWPILVISTIASGWVLAFSMVDLIKELPSIAWVSIAAAALASAAVIVAVSWSF